MNAVANANVEAISDLRSQPPQILYTRRGSEAEAARHGL
jgi:hypothetical protein